MQNYPAEEQIENYWTQDLKQKSIKRLMKETDSAGIRIVREKSKNKNDMGE